jgi:hypothetical protein
MKAFMADPDWQKAYKESEANGKLCQTEVHLLPTDYSPTVKPSAGERVFELHVHGDQGNLDRLNARSRPYGEIVRKHGMTNIGYWVLRPTRRTPTRH